MSAAARSPLLSSEIRWAVSRVLFDPARLGFLLRGGVDDALDLRRFLVHVVPLAHQALRRLRHVADRIPDPALRAQALSSLHSKAYHVAGACILATFLPSEAREHYVEIVAPLETIYDFLDCLCDRHGETSPQAFRQLHQALSDALDPHAPLHEYYLYGPAGDDGDYLVTLVKRVRRAFVRLSEHELLIPHFREATRLYADTQTYKHLPEGERERACIAWHAREAASAGDLSWWEFAAAAGSQFQVYAPLYTAFCSRFEAIAQTHDAYFPALSAMHVLLDSFIDQAEDREHAELNWIACYSSFDDFLQRMHVLSERAREGFTALPVARPHAFTLRIMALFYLSHPKVYAQGLVSQARALLRAIGA